MKKWIIWIIVILMGIGLMAGAVQIFLTAGQTPGNQNSESSESNNTSQEPTAPAYTTREQVYANEHTDLSEKDVRRDVRLGLDRPFYEEPDTVENPDSPDVFVNKHWKLPDDYQPQDLTEADGFQLRQEAADSWQSLKKDLQEKGIAVQITGGYQTPQETQDLYDQAVLEFGQQRTDSVFSRSGFSDSNTGLSLEFSVPGIEDPASDPAYQTIVQEASRYGFIVRYTEDNEGLSQMGSQPLHLRYVGKDLAEDLYNNAVSFDEYFGTL